MKKEKEDERWGLEDFFIGVTFLLGLFLLDFGKLSIWTFFFGKHFLLGPFDLYFISLGLFDLG